MATAKKRRLTNFGQVFPNGLIVPQHKRLFVFMRLRVNAFMRYDACVALHK